MTTPASRTTAQNAQLALLLEVSGTPKPGNVDRCREYPDLRFEHFLAGAVGAVPGFERAVKSESVGEAFERAIAGMSAQNGGNTQFGAILLLTPLVVAAGRGDLSRDGARSVAAETTVSDAVGFYRAFEYVSVAVDDPPDGMDDLDVRRGESVEPVLRERQLTLADVMDRSAESDGIAREWASGFPRTFETAAKLASGTGPVTERASDVYLDLLAEEIDTFVVTQHDRETAREVQTLAKEVLDGEEDREAFARDLVDRGINPGTTADIVAGGLFVALERGMEV